MSKEFKEFKGDTNRQPNEPNGNRNKLLTGIQENKCLMKQWGPVTVWKLNLVRGRMIEDQIEKKLKIKKVNKFTKKIKALRPGTGIESFNQENYKFVKPSGAVCGGTLGHHEKGWSTKHGQRKKWELQVKGREYFFNKTRKEKSPNLGKQKPIQAQEAHRPPVRTRKETRSLYYI